MTHPAPKTVQQAPRRQPATMSRSRKVVTVKSYAYQPSKAELEADVTVKATPDQLARAILQTVQIKRG